MRLIAIPLCVGLSVFGAVGHDTVASQYDLAAAAYRTAASKACTPQARSCYLRQAEYHDCLSAHVRGGSDTCTEPPRCTSSCCSGNGGGQRSGSGSNASAASAVAAPPGPSCCCSPIAGNQLRGVTGRHPIILPRASIAKTVMSIATLVSSGTGTMLIPASGFPLLSVKTRFDTYVE